MRYVVRIDIDLPDPSKDNLSAYLKGLEDSLHSRMPTMKLHLYTDSDVTSSTSRMLFNRQKRQSR